MYRHINQYSQKSDSTVAVVEKFVRERFDIGKPVVDRKECLETEIGDVRFTEDLILGFDKQASPVNREQAENMVLEAARRFALLVAYIAAEQNIKLDDIHEIVGVHHKYNDPREIMVSIRRLQGKGGDRILGILGGLRAEDENLVLQSSQEYGKYIEANRDQLVEGVTNAYEFNLNYARNIMQGYDPDRSMLDSVRSIDTPTSYTKMSGVPPADLLIGLLGEENINKLNKRFYVPNEKEFLEKCPSGIVINLDEQRSLEIVNKSSVGFTIHQELEWSTQIHRVISSPEQGRIVTASHHVFMYPRQHPTALKEAFSLAPDFTKPMDKSAHVKRMVGLKHRSAGEEKV